MNPGLDMPLDEIQAVLSAPDLRARDRDLLEHRAAPPPVGHRRAEETPAAAISEEVGVADALLWYQGALGELRATLAAQGVRADGQHPERTAVLSWSSACPRSLSPPDADDEDMQTTFGSFSKCEHVSRIERMSKPGHG